MGDVAIAENDSFLMNGFPDVFRNDKLCLNLEGTLIEARSESAVYNNIDAFIKTFQSFNIGMCCLANNHIDDVPLGVRVSINNLDELSIPHVGAGETINDAEILSGSSIGDGPYVLNFGWEMIGCNIATKDSPGVNPFLPERSLKLIEETLKTQKISNLVVVVHGNYEFEAYPQPSHRRFAIDAIELGVRAVVFHHSHIVGPVEVYKGRPIAYGLGNWAFSYNRFMNGKLAFPDQSFLQIALEIKEEKDVVHVAHFNPESNEIVYDGFQDIDSEDFGFRAEFSGFSDNEYLAWFVKNRKKRKLLPIFRPDDSFFMVFLKSKWVLLRGLVIDFLVKVRIKSLRRSVG